MRMRLSKLWCPIYSGFTIDRKVQYIIKIAVHVKK